MIFVPYCSCDASLLLVGFLLASFVSTSPTPVDALSLRAPNTNATDLSWGPNDFSIIIAGQGPNPLARKACYVSAVSMLAAQAAQDFHGRLRSPRVAFTQAQYPDLIILVAPTGLTVFRGAICSGAWPD